MTGQRTIVVVALVCSLWMGALPSSAEEPAALPTVDVATTQAVLDLLGRWENASQEASGRNRPAPLTGRTCAFTSASKPIPVLDGLISREVRCWGTELMRPCIEFMDVAGIRNADGTKAGAVHITGVGNRPFSEEFLATMARSPAQMPPRLFFTDCGFETFVEDGKPVLAGAAKIRFVKAAGNP